MNRTAVLLAGLVSVTAYCGPSLAAPSPSGRSCTVAKDPKGDASAASPAASDSALDIVSASLRSDGKVLHAIINVAQWQPLVGEARSWEVTFSNEGVGFSLNALQAADGSTFQAYGPGGSTDKASLGAITGALDEARSRVTLDAPLALLHVRPTARFTEFAIQTSPAVGWAQELDARPAATVGSQELNFVGADSATGRRSYVLNRGC